VRWHRLIGEFYGRFESCAGFGDAVD
jgi:hypothetical protein